MGNQFQPLDGGEPSFRCGLSLSLETGGLMSEMEPVE